MFSSTIDPEPPRRPVPEEQVAKSPPRPHATTKPSPKASSHNHARSSPSHRRNEPSPPQRPPAVTSQPKSNDIRQTSEYIPLETCVSGTSVKRTQRQISIDSVPDEIAPPPPGKVGGIDSDDVFHQPTYDVPPSALTEDNIYKIPPPRPTPNGGYGISADTYDIPPERNSPSTPRSSSSESQKGDSHLSHGFVYDYPPARELSKDDVYDVPPPSHSEPLVNKISLDDVPPVRPPKPSHLIPQTAQEPYMNLPSNSKVFTDLNKGLPVDTNMAPPASCAGMVHIMDTYDIPKSDSARSVTSSDIKETLLKSTPPPPAQCGVEHKYINAAGGFVAEQDVYLPMDPVIKATGTLPPEPRKSSSTDNEVEYTDMSGKSSFDDSFESKPVYDHPPARPAPRVDLPPQRPRKPGKIAALLLTLSYLSFCNGLFQHG